MAPLFVHEDESNESLAKALASMAPPNFIPPAHFQPDYVPPNDGPSIIVVTTTITVVALLVVCSRLYVRATQESQTLRWDDVFIVPAMGLSIAQAVVTILMVKRGGAGKHTYDNSVSEMINEAALAFTIVILYHLVALATKLSILFFVRRFFLPGQKSTMRIFYGYLLFYSTFFTVSMVLNFAKCSPASASWNLKVLILGKPTCLNWIELGTAVNIIYTISDIVLLFIPICIVWKLRLQLTTRIGVVFLFALGGTACVSCLWKTVYLGTTYNSTDITWNLTRVLILNAVEINLAIITASLPALSALLVRSIPVAWKSLLSIFPSNDTSHPSSNVAKDGLAGHVEVQQCNQDRRESVTGSEKPSLRIERCHSGTQIKAMES